MLLLSSTSRGRFCESAWLSTPPCHQCLPLQACWTQLLCLEPVGSATAGLLPSKARSAGCIGSDSTLGGGQRVQDWSYFSNDMFLWELQASAHYPAPNAHQVLLLSLQSSCCSQSPSRTSHMAPCHGFSMLVVGWWAQGQPYSVLTCYCGRSRPLPCVGQHTAFVLGACWW